MELTKIELVRAQKYGAKFGNSLGYLPEEIGIFSAIVIDDSGEYSKHGHINASVTKKGGKYVLTLSNNFSTLLNREEKLFIILHEIGHIVSGHIGNGEGRSLKKEIEADAYAASKIGRNLSARIFSSLMERGLVNGSKENENRLRILRGETYEDVVAPQIEESVTKELVAEFFVQEKGGKEMLKEILLSTAVEVNKGGKKMKKKVSREINKIKEIKFYIKNLKKAKQNEKEYLEEYDFSKFPFNEKFDFFSREDVNMAVLGISSAAVYRVAGFNTFMYDDNFMQLTEETKAFVYYHELGHVVLKHNEKQIEDAKIKKAYRKAAAKGQVHKFEHEADFFAAKMVGKWQALTALEEVKNSLGPATAEMMNKRIKAIFLSDLLD